jgi:hypothetical protein
MDNEMITVNNFEVLEEENVLTEKDKSQNQEEDDLETK